MHRPHDYQLDTICSAEVRIKDTSHHNVKVPGADRFFGFIKVIQKLRISKEQQ